MIGKLCVLRPTYNSYGHMERVSRFKVSSEMLEMPVSNVTWGRKIELKVSVFV